MKVGGYDFIGFIDRLDRDDASGNVAIVDYKTGAIAESAAEYRERVRTFHDFQLPFYYWAREAEGDRDGQVAQRAARGQLDRHFRQDRVVNRQAVQPADGLDGSGAYEVVDRQYHELFRDTIFERFRIQCNPIPGARVIMRRVDVLEQRSIIVRRQGSLSQLSHAEVRQQADDREVAAIDPGARRGGAAAPVHGAERLEPARRPRHHGVNLVARLALRDQALEQCRAQKRQIAREHDDPLVTRVVERREQAAQRPGALDRIRDHGNLQAGVPRGVAGDNPDVVCHRRERGELVFDDAHTADDQRRLVGAAEPARASSREDRCGNVMHSPIVSLLDGFPVVS